MSELKGMTKVYIIESPSNVDVLDGRKEGQALGSILNLAEISNETYGVSDFVTLKLALKRIAEDVIRLRNSLGGVHLHFSMHGCKEGIALTDGTFINWSTFYSIIKEFNDSIGYMTLRDGQKIAPTFLAFSVCEGLEAKIIKTYGDESPYTALVGPTQPVSWSDSLLAYSIYYHNIILKKIGAESAINNMNHVIGIAGLFQSDPGKGFELGNIKRKEI